MKLILTAALAVASLAGAASAHTVRIPFGDLNLSTAAGAAAFDARIDTTARSLCRNTPQTGSRLSNAARCTAAVRAEAVAQLPSDARARYASVRQPITL